ncbi:hypothetical protein B0O44_1123 [Pedobacter nutrimenti]|uniref:Uncharacterized protein n=1 Tax=Pedobacter nutrimenti TaxID=1241337 RepID=A0A318U8T3_9SPHI|nr:hypothetical protein B0O44_1123 [Pedobacter nutrimenti]
MELNFDDKEVDDIKRALIIAMQSSDHWSMTPLFDRIEKILEKIEAQMN